MMRPSILLPYSVACLAICTYSIMDGVMKLLADPAQMGAFNAMVWRNAIGACIGLLLFLAFRKPWPARSTLKLHLTRGTVAAAMAVCFFWGVARVPLAEAVALSFIAPLITLYLAAVLLGEVIRPCAIYASLLGFLGVLVILAGRWGEGAHDTEAWKGIAAIFISAVLYAYNLILQRKQAQVAPPVEIILFQFAIAFGVLLLIAIILTPFLDFTPPWSALPLAHQWPWLLSSGVLSAGSLFLLSWAYARAEAQQLVSVEYTAFIWASLIGWIYFGEPLTIFILSGAALIIIACLIAAGDGGRG